MAVYFIVSTIVLHKKKRIQINSFQLNLWSFECTEEKKITFHNSEMIFILINAYAYTQTK